jgi:sorting nexin-9/18/33
MGDIIAITPPPTTTIHARLTTDFDAGINTSAAWTESREKDHSLSDDELDEDERSDYSKRNGRPARALYTFEGKQEFREVCVEAGDEIEVLREEVGDGWSLVKQVDSQGAVIDLGLLPRTYYTVSELFLNVILCGFSYLSCKFTADFSASPSVLQDGSSHHKGTSRREASSSSITPRGSPSTKPVGLPLVPQSTGEWFPSFRRSLLRGKSINRFSNFVTSGAEEWIINGVEDIVPPPTHQKTTSGQDDEDDGDSDSPPNKHGIAEADIHFVDERPSWRAKVPPFRILVHSPSKRASVLASAYTVYSVTSIFQLEEVDSDSPSASSTRITVHRRFSHFVALHTALSRRLPGIALPPLPEKQYAGRFSNDFVEARRGDLERYIGKIARHPVARYAEVLTFFLSCESEIVCWVSFSS